MSRFFLILFTFFALHAGATDKKCVDIISLTSKESEVVPSGRDEDLMPGYREAVKEIFGEGGILEKLGVARPPHIIEFVPSGELALLATLNRHAVGHFRDGATLAKEAWQSSGVMEFANPGCPTCRSYYRDTTPHAEQLGILFHVAGHNDFSSHSMFNRLRNPDRMVDSMSLFELMEKTAEVVGRDEVSQWFQYLLSLDHLQDLVRGTYESPESFINDTTKRIKHPRRKTPNVLQALLHNLPAGTPQWKKDMLVLFERVERFLGFIIPTKIMNEGWATMMMEIIPGHSTKWQSTSHQVDYAELFENVLGNGINFRNPYWLGREAWRAVRARFNDQLHIKVLNPLERDRAFIAEAHRLIEQMDDYSFIRYALDEKWVRKHKLFLARMATREEYDWNLPPDPKYRDQWIVTSTDAGRIVESIVTRTADHRLHFPQIELENLNAFGRGVVSLNHQTHFDIPLVQESAAQTLFVLSQILERPVSLKTQTVSVVEEIDWGGNWWSRSVTKKLVKQSRRIEVESNGKVSVYILTDGKEILSNIDSSELQMAVDYLKDENVATFSDNVAMYDRARFRAAMGPVVEKNLQPGMEMTNHSPTAAKALLEYASMLKRRLHRVMKLLKEGKLPFFATNSGIRVRVLPPTPRFELDQQVVEELNELNPSPVSAAQAATTQAAIPDGDSNIGSGNRKPGDKFWGPGKNGNGNGPGKPGKGKPKPGDPDEPSEPGSGEDPDFIDIPLEVYGQLLAEDLELPNLRPKSGETEIVERTKEGGVRRPHGDLLVERMVPMILAIGEKAIRSKGREPTSRSEILKEGLRRVRPEDYVVVNKEETPIPDVNAVVVVTRDMSGSMNGARNEVLRKFFFKVKALLSTKYKSVVFRFVGFSGEAHEFTEQDFWHKFIGGGTDYSKGVKKSSDILESYDSETWDKFLFLGGDWEDINPTGTVRELEILTPKIQYNAVIYTKVGGFADESIIGKMEAWSRKDPAFGFSELTTEADSEAKALKKLFGKKQQSD